MTRDCMYQRLMEEGKNPEDYLFLITNDSVQVWGKEFAPSYASYASEEDKPIKEDVDTTAETVIYTAMDVQDLADMLLYALQEIATLKGVIDNG